MGGRRMSCPRSLAIGEGGECFEEATRGRSASHHLRVKAALALLYDVLGSTNPFAECPAPKFAPEKTELRYHTSSQLGELLRELREDRRSYFGHLTYHLAVALFSDEPEIFYRSKNPSTTDQERLKINALRWTIDELRRR